ncbi:phospholipase D family protein [Oceanobacillus chungangensis]|nr:phospholipase D family protein [Oceanobacillus chungangensis]
MGIQLLHKDIGGEFFNLLEGTTEAIYIMSPFISYPTAHSLATWLEESEYKVECKIITRFNREEFIQGANSINGLERLLEAGAELFALQHLHSKLYIFDEKNIILGSANFTLSGFFKNHELGLIVKNEVEFSKHCVDYFMGSLHKICELGDYRITNELVKKELEAVTKATTGRGKMKQGSNPNEFNQKRWGAVIDVNENSIQSNPSYNFKEHFDILEDINTKDFIDAENFTGARIKFEGNSNDRISNKEVYVTRKKYNYEFLNRTFYPLRPRSVQDGEYLFIAVLSKDKFGNDTPMIVGYATTYAYKDENVIDETNPKFKKWNGRYPYYIEFTNGKFLKMPVENGISLIELVNGLKHKVYPGTIKSPEIPISQILKRHHQKAHIKITNEAKQFLITRLDKLFDEHGYDTIL